MDKERVTIPRIETIRSRLGLREPGGSTLAKVWVRALVHGSKVRAIPLREEAGVYRSHRPRSAGDLAKGPVVKNWLVAAKRS